MESKECVQFSRMALVLVLTLISTLNIVVGLETYIVHLKHDGVGSQALDLDSWYNSFLPSRTTDSDEKPSMVHTYCNVFTGFAAKLSAKHVKAMEKKDGFILARPQTISSLHTTHTPTFLGLHKNLGAWQGVDYGKGVIIGVLDTGITSGHPSFNDEGMPPPPAKWKGKCELKGDYGCNNKLIGARNFLNNAANDSPVDQNGHGTHTSSTAAGNFVGDANVFGNAYGTASGMPLLPTWRCTEYVTNQAAVLKVPF